MNNELSKKIVWQHKVAEYLSYILLLLVPLYISSTYLFTTNTPKILVTMTLSILILVFYLWGNWSSKLHVKLSLLGIMLGFFILSLTLSSINGIDQLNSFFGWRNVTPLIIIYALAVISVIIGNLIRKDKKIVPRLLISSFITSIIVMIIFYTGLKGVDLTDGSTLGNSSYLGAYLFFNFFFGIALLFYYKKIWQMIPIIAGSLFLVINPLFINKNLLLFKLNITDILNNPLSMLGIANGATMGVGVSVLFAIFLFLFFSKKKSLKIIGASLIFIFTIGVCFVSRELVTSGTHLNKVFTEIKSGNRFLVWDISKKEFNSNPILGNGYNNYIYSFDKYYNPQIYSKGYAIERFFKPHNVIFEFVSETGILGLSSYLLLLVILFGTILYKIKEDESFRGLRIILASILIGYFIQNLFVFDTISSYLLLFIIIAIGLGFTKIKNLQINNNLGFIFNKVLIVLVMIFSVVSMYLFVVAPHIEASGMAKIFGKDNVIDITKSIKLREGLNEKSLFGGVMDNDKLSQSLFNIYQDFLAKIDQNNKKPFLDEINSIVKSLELDISKQPNYSEPYITIGKMLNLYLMADMKEGKNVRFNGTNYNKEIWDKSYKSITKGIELNPNDPQSYLVLSQLYMLKADFVNARYYIKTAIDIAPEFKDSYNFAGFIQKINPDKDFGDYVNEMGSKWMTTK